MKRLLIFSLLGPLLGVITFLWIMLPVMSWLLGDPINIDWHQIVLFPMAYVLGLLPAFLTGLFDSLAARKALRPRIVWTALFGFAIGFLPLAGALTSGSMHGPYVLLWGLIGAAPAALCSWLAGR